MMFHLPTPWLVCAPAIVGCASTPTPAPVALHHVGSSTIARFVRDVAARLAEGRE